jgi:hypothetical protein
VGEIALQTRSTTRVVVKNDGKVGIGMVSPAYKLDISGSTSTPGSTIVNAVQDGAIVTEPSIANPPPAAITGSATATAAGNYAAGVIGFGAGPDAIGVVGANSSTSGYTMGVLGTTVSTDGKGVVGQAEATSGYTFGVAGQAESSPNGTGVYGEGGSTGRGVRGSGGNYGVYGTATATNGKGVAGEANSGSNAYGIYGQSSSGYAGFFDGKVHVNGELTKSSGSFKIDHPLGPADKYLSHSFVESPDMMNIYNGVTPLDAKGEAWVSLPEWFEALNSDFRYQLTAIGAPQPNLYIASEISVNRFKIAGGKRGMKVSWQVTGIRQDAYARGHRIRVEEEKPLAERGLYLHPEVFGQPKEKGIEWAHRPEQMRPTQKEQAALNK